MTPFTLEVKHAKKLAELADAKMLAKLGAQVIRVKNKHLCLLGEEIEKLGIRRIGHGKIAIASHNAEEIVGELGAYVKHLIEATDTDPEKVAGILAIHRDFNRQLMDAGEMHIKASASVESNNTASTSLPPFPAGSLIQVHVGPKDTKQIEDNGKPS